MQLRRYGYFLILFACLISVSMALIPDRVVITSDKPWVIAGGTEPVQITVYVENNSYPLATANVRMWCENTEMGAITPAPPQYRTTGATGSILSPFSFTYGTKSGTAILRIEVSDPQTGIYYSMGTFEQYIDHAEPKNWSILNFISPIWVNNETDIIVQMMDRYGNIVDNRREAEIITFYDSEDGNGGFWDGEKYVNKLSIPINSQGKAIATYKVSSNPSGGNYVFLTAPETVVPSTQWITIYGNATTPAAVRSVITSTTDLNTASPHSALANNRDLFTIKYVVEDRYGNPVPDITIEWTSSRGEMKTFQTNEYGYILLKYGPSTRIQTVDLTVTARITNDFSISRSDTLNFISGGAEFMEVGASPQLLPSRDIKEEAISNITALVVDSAGRPVSGETVSFSIVRELEENSTILYRLPTLSSSSDPEERRTAIIITDAGGRAVVQYHPGEFPKFGQDGFIKNASGTSTVFVTWAGHPTEDQELTISYKNYPYIAVMTSAEPPIVEEGEYINVTIKLVSDGYAVKNAVDVVLLEDRANTMLLRVDKGINEDEDRMLHAQNAARIFLSMMEPGVDRVGIVSYGEKTNSADLTSIAQMKKLAGDDNSVDDDEGYINKYYPSNPRPYSDYATIDLNLTNDFNSGDKANIVLDQIVPFKNSFGGQPSAGLRYGIYTSITHILDSNPEGSRVKAVVGLLDTDWSWYGDPKVGPSGNPAFDPLKLGGGTNQYFPFEDPVTNDYTGKWSLSKASENWQNMSNYAGENGIRIYMVTYTPDVPASRRATISEMCKATGGFHVHAATPEELIKAFQLIAEDIKSSAGEYTVMNLDLSSVNVTYVDIGLGSPGLYPGNQVFNYTHIEDRSTRVESCNYTWSNPDECVPITDPLFPPYPAAQYPYVIDQTEEWETSSQLSFYVGNMSIKQEWVAMFTLKTNMSGGVCFFGQDSQICFNDFEDKQSCESVPPVCVTVKKNYTAFPKYPGDLDIKDGSIQATNTSPGVIDVTWKLWYNGTHPVTQTGYYRFSGDGISWLGDWIKFGINRTGSPEEGKRVLIDYQEFPLIHTIGEQEGCWIYKIFSYEDLGGGEIGNSDVEEMSTDNASCINSTARIRIR